MSVNKYPITLILTLGSSPSILTETVWAIYQNGWGPIGKIEIITTQDGKDRMEEKLQTETREGLNGFDEVCKAVGIYEDINTEYLNKHIHIPSLEEKELKDIKNAKQDTAMADLIKNKVQEHAQISGVPIIASLAGGRKTMAARLSSAMELFGRPYDRMVHVLVNPPYDKIGDFFYPKQAKQELEYPKESGKTMRADKAKVVLIRLPFLQLGTFIRTGFDTDASLDDLMKEVRRDIYVRKDKSIHHFKLNLKTQEVTINKAKNTFKISSHRGFSILCLLAIATKYYNKADGISFEDIINENLHDTLHEIYEICKGYKIEKKDDTLYNAMDKYKKHLKYSGDAPNHFARNRHTLKNQLEEGIREKQISLRREDIFKFHDGRKAKNTLNVRSEDITIEGGEALWEDLK